MTAVLEVLKPGPSTTVRGGPIYGRAHRGFSGGGAFDPRSHAIANALVGNSPEARALEIVVGGVRLRALGDLDVAIVSEGQRTELRASAGSIVDVDLVKIGLRAYLAIAGGFADAEGTTVAKGDPLFGALLPSSAKAAHDAELASIAQTLRADPIELRVVDSVQSSFFAKNALDPVFTVARDSDRRGIRLEGARVEGAREILTEGANVGSVQVPPSGEPIILGVDRSTTGGYAKIANVVEADRWILGQLRPGARVRLRRVERNADL